MADIHVQPSSDIRPRFAGTIWGEAKTGKTTYAMSLPGRKLLVNFDPDGYTSVAYRDDFDVIDLSMTPIQDVINQARKSAAYALENKDKYQSVIIDSLTVLAEVCLIDAVDRKVGKSDKFTPTLDAPGLTGYGARNNNFNDIIRRFLNVTARNQQHIMLIAHSDDPEMGADQKTLVRQTIMLSAKMRNTAALKVSEIYHLTARDARRTLYLAPYGIKEPMGSRMFDTVKVPKFDLQYSIDVDDAKQPHALCNIYETWVRGGLKKLITVPK